MGDQFGLWQNTRKQLRKVARILSIPYLFPCRPERCPWSLPTVVRRTPSCSDSTQRYQLGLGCASCASTLRECFFLLGSARAWSWPKPHPAFLQCLHPTSFRLCLSSLAVIGLLQLYLVTRRPTATYITFSSMASSCIAGGFASAGTLLCMNGVTGPLAIFFSKTSS